MPKERLDVLLVERGLAATRSKAQALIIAGRVYSADTRLDKAGTRVETDRPLTVTEGPRFVGRGGLKLDGVLDLFGVDVSGHQALDVGASTGGFTDVLLQRGATAVVALDVGRGQLDWGLRNDPRVHVVEGVNARYLEVEKLPYRPSRVVIDVSFISLTRVLPSVVRCLAADGEIVALVKPQFEAGRADVGRGGIVRNPAVHLRVLDDLCGFARDQEWSVAGVEPSPLRGADGNQEFFLHLCPSGDGLARDELATRIRSLAAQSGKPS